MSTHRRFLEIGILALVVGPLTAAVAGAVDPYAQPDDSWISISGTVVDPTADAFTLDYGEGVILVEMDDWDNYGDAYGLMDGDQVVVYGEIDDDLYEASKIEAGSVYVENLNTYFYASRADEEGAHYTTTYWATPTPLVLNRTTVRGTVTGVSPARREFTVDTGSQKLTVDTDLLGYNPLDRLGFQKVEKGDRVSVTGDIDIEFIDGRVLEADSIVTLSDATLESKQGDG